LAAKTKADILARHQANMALKAPAPPPVSRHARDLSADGMISPLDERIIAAAADALEAGQTHYVDVPGIAPLRAALADYLNAAFGAHCETENIIVTAGVQESRFLSIQMIGAMYDSIGIPAVAHPGVQKALGVRARRVVPLAADAERGYLPSPAAIADAVKRGCRLLYLESPARLSGAAYTDEDLAIISAALREHDALAIWDQGLAPWVDGKYSSLAAFDERPSLAAAIGAAWPGMRLASWFSGYIAAPADQTPAMQSQKQIMAICTSTAAQHAALEAANLFEEARAQKLTQLSRLRRDISNAADALNLEAIAGDALNIMALHAPEEAAARLRGAGFDYADGASFGAPAVIRLSVNTSTMNALAALR